MFKRILVPFDGSENAERVLPWVKRYAGPDIAEVFLLRAVQPALGGEFPSAHEVEDARDYLYRMERELNYAGIPARVATRTGPPADAIVKAASILNCELIIIATRGGSPVQRWLIGGTTEKVMRRATVPVLVVRSRTPMPRQGKVRRIVVPLDGSLLAETVLPWAEKLARFHRARLALLHIHPAEVRGAYDALRTRVTRFCQTAKRRGIKVDFRARLGDPADQILRYTRQGDVVVTSTHGHGGFKRLTFGSVAERIIREADVPVFIHRPVAVAAQVVRKRETVVL